MNTPKHKRIPEGYFRLNSRMTIRKGDVMSALTNRHSRAGWNDINNGGWIDASFHAGTKVAIMTQFNLAVIRFRKQQ